MFKLAGIRYLRTTLQGHAITEYGDSGVISLGRKGGGGGLGRGAAESGSEDLMIRKKHG